MDVEFEKSRNELLKRTNVFVKIRSIKTPSKNELKTKVASILACNEGLVVVDKISQEFGSRTSSAYVKIYDDFDSLKKIELEHNIRDILKEEKEKQDALKAEKKERKDALKNKADLSREDASEAKEETKEETKEESKEESKDEAKEEAKEESKDEAKDEAKEEDKSLDENKEEPSKKEDENKDK